MSLLAEKDRCALVVSAATVLLSRWCTQGAGRPVVCPCGQTCMRPFAEQLAAAIVAEVEAAIEAGSL